MSRSRAVHPPRAAARRSLRALLVAALLLSACKTVSYRTGAPGGGERTSRNASFFLFGAVGTATIDLTEACPQGVSSWSNRKSAVDTLLSIVTLGIYTPRTIRIECAPKGPTK